MLDDDQRKKLAQVAKELATPIDFERLIQDGIIARRSARWYQVLDMNGLPSHVSRQATEMEFSQPDGKVFFKLPTSWKQAQSTYRKLMEKTYDE